ncbi:MAG: TetR/AcrR family transcriptional regulator [Planctomycetota bacterium]
MTTPKQLELRDRERRILKTALPLVADAGLNGLSMEAVARKISYTRGTVYNHFKNKEEILLALAVQASSTRLAMFQHAVELSTRTRDQMSGVGVACEDFVARFPGLFRVESIVRSEAVWKKTTPARRNLMQTCERDCFNLLGRVIENAITAGDLTLPRGVQPPDVLMALWSLTYGGFNIAASSPDLAKVGLTDPAATIRRNCSALMDGYDWQPLYDATSFNRLRRRVLASLAKNISEPVDDASDASASIDHSRITEAQS